MDDVNVDFVKYLFVFVVGVVGVMYVLVLLYRMFC